MQLAKKIGLNVANVQLLHYGKHAVLLVERFDRKLINKEVKRRLVIDGCQALNLPPEYKYERNFGSGRDVANIREGVSLKKLFNFTHYCIQPAIAKQQLLDWVLFNLIIHNADAHGKNVSFFVGSKGITLAPFYDLINVRMFKNFDQEMAMAIGDAFDFNEVHRFQLEEFAFECQLTAPLVIKRFQYLKKALAAAILDLQQELNDQVSMDYLKDYVSNTLLEIF